VNTCSDHAGALVVYTADACPVCYLLTFTKEFEGKLLDVERDIREMKATNTTAMSQLTQDIVSFAGRSRQ